MRLKCFFLVELRYYLFQSLRWKQSITYDIAVLRNMIYIIEKCQENRGRKRKIILNGK